MPVSHAQTRHPGSPSIHNGTMLGKDLSYRRAVSPKTPRWIRPAFLTSCGVLAIVMSSCSSGSSPSSSTTTTQTATTTTSGSALSAAAIRTLQAALSKVGCYTGEVDGVGGPLTTAAVRSFQAAEGLAVDGVYGSSTKSRLATAVAAGTRVCASSTTTTSSAVTTTTAASAAPAAATAAINAYETANGPPVGTWQITATQVSSVDPSVHSVPDWSRAGIPGHRARRLRIRPQSVGYVDGHRLRQRPSRMSAGRCANSRRTDSGADRFRLGVSALHLRGVHHEHPAPGE